MVKVIWQRLHRMTPHTRGVHCTRCCRFKSHDRQTDKQTLRASVRIVCISCIRCSLKTGDWNCYVQKRAALQYIYAKTDPRHSLKQTSASPILGEIQYSGIAECSWILMLRNLFRNTSLKIKHTVEQSSKLKKTGVILMKLKPKWWHTQTDGQTDNIST